LYLKYTEILGTDTANQLSFAILEVNKLLSRTLDNNE
jgi:hypothetical protein